MDILYCIYCTFTVYMCVFLCPVRPRRSSSSTVHEFDIIIHDSFPPSREDLRLILPLLCQNQQSLQY